MPALNLGASPCGIASLLPRLASGPLFAPIRRRRSSFKPTTDAGPYRLPRQVQKALGAALSPYRNAEAAFALATFLGRFWTAPGRLGTAFPIDRRALADHQELELTEAKVRGAILTLERIGFLSRPQRPKGSLYKATEDGLRRKPILYVFGMLFRAHFETANLRRLLAEQSRVVTRLPSTDTNSPKDRILFLQPKGMIMGQVSHLSKIEAPIDPENPLEKALTRFKQMIGKS